MQVGDVVLKGGFFTQALYLRGQSSAELERRLGYGAGRLAQGWRLLFMLDLPGVEDFEFRGYTHFSGGVVQGHLNPPDKRTAEDRLRESGVDVLRSKQKVIREVFRLHGPNRLAKVIPVRTGTEYPPGSGIPQWTLVRGREKRFEVAAFVAPGQLYNGNYT
jgi:hypothetical protein